MNVAHAHDTDATDCEDPELLKLYLQQIARHGLLSASEEVEISKAMSLLKREMQDLQADGTGGVPSHLKSVYRDKEKALLALKNRMVESNLRLVVSIAKRYRSRGLSFLDLISEGNLGLLAAVDRFDYRKGCRFSSYATYWIRQTVLKGLADRGALIRRPIHMQAAVRKLHLATQYLTQELCHNVTPDELGSYLNWSKPHVREVLQIGQDAESLDRSLDGEGGNPFSDTIRDEKNVAPESDLMNFSMHSYLEEVLRKLPVRETRILRLRFGIGHSKCYTLQEIGQAMGLTKERVRQLQNLSLARLRGNPALKELIETS